MKRTFLLFFLVTMVTSVFAYSFESGGIYYNITSSANLTVEVTYGKKYGEYYGVVTIPQKVENDGVYYVVKSIGSNAFSGCSGLSKVVISPTVTSIGSSAFSGCNAMTDLTIPANVTSIDNYAFSGCVALMYVTIEDSENTLSLGYGAMDGSNRGLFRDSNLRRFYWGRPLSYNTNYGLSPIAYLTKVSEITIGPKVKTLSPYMFYGNTAITQFELPATVTSL